MTDSLLNFRRQGAALAALVALFLCGGCSSRATPESEDQAAAAAAGAAASVDVQVVDRVGYDEVLAGQRGKVVLVDFWATWCAPCLEQLPHTTALAEAARGRGLAVLTVSMDDREDVVRIKSELARRGGAATTNLVSRDGGGSRAMEAFEIDGGAVPHYKLYDRAGQLRKTFGLDPAAAEQFTGADIAAAVGELLAEPSP